MKIFVDRNTLTDGSHTYAVRLTRFADMPRSIDTLVFEAVSRDDAQIMARAMDVLVNEHSMEIAAFQGMPD